ncbi:pitrilysin family protein [soil metagenome]
MRNSLNTRAAWLPLIASLALTPVAVRGQQVSAPVPQETPPLPAAPRSVNIPKPDERTLKNGLRVIVIEDHDVPLISAQVLVKNGGEIDPPQLSGLADMTASLLTKGTKTRSAPEIAQQIEALGGAIDSGAGWDASRASINVMSSRIEPALVILADISRNPVFNDEEIERLRQQYLDSLSVTMRQPGALANLVAGRVVFGDAAYGHPLSGTPESLARIKRTHIVGLHSQFYRPDNAVLVIGGDIKTADAFKLAERVFGDWVKPTTPLSGRGLVGKMISPDEKQRVVVVDMPDAGQAAVVLARAGISRSDPDYYRGIVTNAVLTGYSGRLNQEIRIKRGLSYGASSRLDTRRDAGPFVASAQTKNTSGAEVASLLVGELGRLSKEPVAAAELVPRKAVLTGGFGRALETTEGLVGQIASLSLHGLSLSEINNYISNVQSVTAPEILKFAGGRISVKNANIIIVGQAKDFLEPLRKQFSSVEVIPFAELDLNSSGLRKTAAATVNK